MKKVCSACGDEIGGGKMGMLSHWGAHRRAFKKHFGHNPLNNDELRAYVKGLKGYF